MQAIQDNYQRFKYFSNQYPNFIFYPYSFHLEDNSLEIEFYFKLKKMTIFKPRVKIFSTAPFANKDKEIIDNLIFNIGMIELISYWKATCSKNIIIKKGTLNQTQIEWWKNLYYNGLGEFLYLNGLIDNSDKESLFNIQIEEESNLKPFNYSYDDTVIVPIGGGKDSIVTTMMLKERNRKIKFLIMNPRLASIDTVLTAGYSQKDIITIHRTIAPELIELNERNFLNGHTPFSALLSFYSILVAYLYGHSEIALSNEDSANEATIHNSTINHQYSKSLDYETSFREYCAKYISPNFNYYSFLRKFSELEIIKHFIKYPQFFKVFKSCNVGSKTNTWCANCPKCLFTYIMLSAFISDNELIEIFGENMLEKEGMMTYYHELIGITSKKPFECVGTVKEVKEALKLAINRRNETQLPLILQDYKNNFLTD